MYDYHIKDAYEMGYKYIDFYGITGDFDKNNKYYAGVDSIKRNNKVYDNYQFAEINKSFSKYINDNINTIAMISIQDNE